MEKNTPHKYPKQSVLELAAGVLRFTALFVVGVVWVVPFWLALPFSLARTVLLRVLPAQSRVLRALQVPFDAALGSFGACTLAALGIRAVHRDAASAARLRAVRGAGVPCVVAYQHVCIADPLVMCTLFPEARYVLKHELCAIFWLFYPALLHGFVAVRRGDAASRARCQHALVATLRDRGHTLAIAPEGTRNATGDPRTLLPFRKGAFVASTAVGAPVVPVVHWNADRAWAATPAAVCPRPTTVVVEVLEPVHPRPGETPDELQERVRAAMQHALIAHAPPPAMYTLSPFQSHVLCNIPAFVILSFVGAFIVVLFNRFNWF